MAHNRTLFTCKCIYRRKLNLQSNGILELVEGDVELDYSEVVYHFRAVHSLIEQSHTTGCRDNNMHCWMGQVAHEYHYIRCISATTTEIESAVNSVTTMVCGASPTIRCSRGNLPQGCTHALSRDIRRGCEGGCVCGGVGSWLE